MPKLKMVFQSVHLDLHDCDPQLIRNEEKIREYHLALDALCGNTDHQVKTFLFGGTPEVYGYSSVAFGPGFVADGHYADNSNRVFLDVIFDREMVKPGEVFELAKKVFESQDQNHFNHNSGQESPERRFYRGRIGIIGPEFGAEEYHGREAWGLSTHLDILTRRKFTPDDISGLIHDQIPPLITANAYGTPETHSTEKEFSFVQLIDTSAIYGMVQPSNRGKPDEKLVLLDVFSCKWYSMDKLLPEILKFFEADQYSAQPLLRK